MVDFVSPGVYFVEKDDSQYPPTVRSSIVGIVGFASKGPVNIATLITTPQQLVDTFGEPNESLYGQGLIGAIEILETTNQIYFVRAVSEPDASFASATLSIGGCPAVWVAPNSIGVNTSGIFTIQVWDHTGTPQFTSPRQFSVPSGTATFQAQALKDKIGGSVDSDKVGVFYDSTTNNGGYIVGLFAGSGAYMAVSATVVGVGSALMSPIRASGEVEFSYASGVSAHGTSIFSSGTGSLAYYVQTLFPGAGYNDGLKSNGAVSGNSITISNIGDKNFIVKVNEKGVAKENYKASFTSGNNFIEEIINVGTTDTISDVIQGYLINSGTNFVATKLNTFLEKATSLGAASLSGIYNSTSTVNGFQAAPLGTSSTTVNPRFLKIIVGNYSLSGGRNGVSTDTNTNDLAVIGRADQSPKTGIQALDDQNLDISIAVVPDVNTQAVQNALISLAEATQNFIVPIAPPFSVGNGTAQAAINWSNGQSSERTAAINSSFAAIYWPWVQTFSVFDGKDRWLDPAIYAARQMCYTDSVSDPWFAPAGYSRGRLTKPTAVEVKLSQGERDALYSGGNVINPVASFPQQGITIFGQRTAQRLASALDRVNVRRLMIYIKKILTRAGAPFVMQPNDEFTWEQMKTVIEPLIDDIIRRRGIKEARVVIDETVNTPVRIDRNELWTKILIKPTKAAEIIVMEVNLTNQSAQLGNL